MFKIIKEAEENEEYYAIFTDGETYPVVKRDGKFLITREHSSDFSGNWEFLGVTGVRKFVLSIIEPEDALKITDWKFKNGNPKYAVVDKDHGSTRTWGGTAGSQQLRSFEKISKSAFDMITSK